MPIIMAKSIKLKGNNYIDSNTIMHNRVSLSNILDSLNYESGTFIPNIKGNTVAGTATYTVQEGQYIRIGKLLFYNFRLGCTLTDSRGYITIGGFPVSFIGRESSIGNVITGGGDPFANFPYETRIYGQRLLIDNGGLAALNDINWTTTRYIYGTGFIILQ